MNLNNLFEMGGMNLWIVVSGNGLNLILEGIILFASAALGAQGASGAQMAQVVMMLGTFLAPLLVAFICGRMEREQYRKYALYTLPGALLPTLLAILASPIYGIMLAVVAVLGALNGARLAEMTVERHSR